MSSLKLQIQLLEAQFSNFNLWFQLEAEAWDWTKGEPPWMKRGEDGKFGGGGSSPPEPSAKENSGDKAKDETLEAETVSDAVVADLTTGVESVQTMQAAITTADLGESPGTEALKDSLQDAATEVAQAVTQSVVSEQTSLLSKDVIKDPDAFLKGIKQHAREKSALLAVDAARLAVAGLVGVVQAVANDPAVREASGDIRDAVARDLQDKTDYINNNITDVAFAKQQAKNLSVALSKAGQSLSEHLTSFMKNQVEPYKERFDQLQQQQAADREKAKAKYREQVKQPRAAAAAASLKIDLTALKTVDDIDSWATQLPTLLQALKGVDVPALTERLGDAAVQKAIASEFKRLLAATK